MNALQPSPAESPAVENAATMRTLVGVDEGRSYIPAIRLLARLDFKGNEAILVHVEQPIGTVYNPVPLAYDYGDDANAEKQAREFGETLLEEAASAARLMDLGIEPKTVYALGTSSGRLMEVADEEGADLVAIGSRRQGTLESFFLGSVGRALAIAANQSFLVARGRPASDG
ncbi:universal stress protein, partial [bacterium]